MRTRALLLLAVLPWAAQAGADTDPPFQLMRFDENYAYLKDAPQPLGWDDSIKYLPIGADAYLSLGGELRERFDVFSSPRFGIDGTKSDSYLLQRVLFSADLHVSSRFRIYTELAREDEFGKRTALLPVDRNQENFQLLFADFVPDEAGNFLIRLGRQEFILNPTQRFVSAREGPNIRQSFDGGRLSWKRGPWTVDAFSFRPLLEEPNAFDDRGDPNALFSGLSVSHSLGSPARTLQAYWLAYDHFGARFGTTVGDERRRMLGMRYAQKGGSWDLDLEGLVQYGTFADTRIHAWGTGLDGGYTWQTLWEPRLGLRLDGASGGDLARDGDVQTFNPLFPKGLNFDESLLTTYANLLSIRPSVTLRPASTVSVQLSEAWRWRDDPHDALYLIPFVAVPTPLSDKARYVGQWSVLDTFWRPGRYWTFQGEYVHVVAGPAVTRAVGHSVDFLMLIAQFRF